MQVIKAFFIPILLFVPFIKGFAAEMKDKVSLGFNTYGDNRDVQVYSPTFAFFKALGKEFMVGLKMRVDAISAASIRNGGKSTTADAVTGASGRELFDDIRYAPTLIGIYNDGINSASGGVYYSKEKDYEGKSFFASYVRQLNEENTAVGFGISQSADRWDPMFDRELPRDYRRERKIDLSISQLISPEISAQAVYSHMDSNGFLSSPYHYVSQDALAKFENYPKSRKGDAVALKGVALLNDATSMNILWRYYRDDWEIASNTLNAEVLRDVSDNLVLGLRGRYYTQSGADFAKSVGTYTLSDEYFAADYRMTAFDSYTVGAPVIYTPYMISGVKVTGSVDYYMTSDNAYIKEWYGEDRLKAVFATIAVDYEF